MSTMQLIEWIERLDDETSRTLLFGAVNALLNDDQQALQDMKVRISQMIVDDNNQNIIRLY